LIFGSSTEIRATELPTLAVTLRQSDFPQATAEWKNDRRTLLLDAGGDQSSALLGRLDLTLLPEAPYIQIDSQVALEISPDLAPDPTITSVIEFVESEAHRYETRNVDRRHHA